jgi:putative membrane protein
LENLDISLEKIPYKKNWLYILFLKPNLYLYKLLKHTIFVGVVAFCLSYAYMHSGFSDAKIPTTMHSLIGIAIGFLIVFRATTSYDRWFEAKKSLSNISKYLSLFVLKLNSSTSDNNIRDKVKESLKGMLESIEAYLKTENEEEEEDIKQIQNEYIYEILTDIKSYEKESNISSKDAASLEQYLTQIFDNAGVCERIKDTPIPTSFSLHIKISVFIYILTLPFGLFYDLGLWSTFMVMIIFYIIYGIEIISSEIENPFYGDPNDLPIEEFTKKSIDFVEKRI